MEWKKGKIFKKSVSKSETYKKENVYQKASVSEMR